MQELCDHIAFIKEGKLIADEPISAIAQDAPYEITVVSDDKRLATILKKLPEVRSSKAQHTKFSFTYIGDISKLIGILAHYPLIDVSITKGDLESTFMEFYKD